MAAESCYVTQPAVSAAVRELEQEYGVSLFHRKKKQLELTDEGRWFRQRAEFILSYVTATEEQMRIYAMNKRYLRVGVAPMIGGSFFYSVYDQFVKEHPEIHIDLLEGGSLQVWQWVEDGIVDIGVQLLDFLPTDAVETVKLFDTELVFCVGSTHSLADRESVNIEDLAGQKLILLKEDSYQNKLLKQMFADAGQKIDIMMYSNQINSILSMLSHGS
jgi:DNA-binding transcriptional LysR family regulator